MAVIFLTGTFENCKCNYENGEKYSPKKPLEILANNGTTFPGTYSFKEKDSEGGNYSYYFINEGNRLVPDYSNFNVKNAFNSNSNIVLFDNYISVGGVVETNEFTNIYLTNSSELTELSRVRYVDREGSITDYGEFISNLYKIPLIIPNDFIIKEKTNIILGNRKVDVKSSLITTDTITIDLGNISVKEEYNNVYDYINSSFILHIPFFDKFYLNSEYVVNETISINCVIDLYSGNATVNIYSSFIEGIIESRVNLISSMIPFIQSRFNSVVGSISTINNNIKQAYIEVVRNIPYNTNSMFGGSTIEYGKLGNFRGFTRCDNVSLITNANNSEKEEIKKLLKEGVII